MYAVVNQIRCKWHNISQFSAVNLNPHTSHQKRQSYRKRIICSATAKNILSNKTIPVANPHNQQNARNTEAPLRLNIRLLSHTDTQQIKITPEKNA